MFAASYDLLELGADALVCAAPIPYHAPISAAAVDAGLHVLCEKPFSIVLREFDELIAARDRAGRIVQIGYMKRFDPSYGRLLELLPPDPAELVLVATDVTDPQERPFTEGWRGGNEVVAETRDLEAALIAEALGSPVAEDAYRAYRHGYLSSLIHDVNLIHGILAAVRHPLPVPVVDGAFWAAGTGVSAAWKLDGGGRAEARHVALPGGAYYRERVTVLARSRIFELSYSSPYLPRRPARLVERRSVGSAGLETVVHHVAYEDAFRRQLLAFHAAIVADAEPVNTLEEARRDLEALQAAHAAARR